MPRTPPAPRLSAALAVVALALGLLLPAPAVARLQVDTRTRYEMVWGRSERELSESVVDHVFTTAVNSPTAAAMCGAMPEVKYTIEGKDGRYSLKSWLVKLTVVYYYPKWGNSSYATIALRNKWQDYQRVLRAHEETHGRIAREYAVQVDEALRHVPDAADPGVIRQAVHMTFTDIWEDQRRAQSRFDEQSNPVRFPLPENFQPRAN